MCKLLQRQLDDQIAVNVVAVKELDAHSKQINKQYIKMKELKNRLAAEQLEKTEIKKALLKQTGINNSLQIKSAEVEHRAIQLQNELRQAKIDRDALVLPKPVDKENIDMDYLAWENEYLKNLVKTYGHKVLTDHNY